ncbi:ketoacyl-ACP synthase III [Helicobacter cholecystus]|uniref:Beta-ketoacyl-[acyl-carrier-protein] synthase III n=1 Tax=Helicobacter cholecystus TaxID=45498 RepID=A0A3D8IUF1_9HELI|nr:beta-ketoacyl-ACP synthase III [Helicobacter cholecystus]RDU68919.1 ketoacyl-ACP synthase III [Helicobacter cholecystus]VEJ25896.1 3-oxoacyl-(acyl carrier protein) synthase III [Helicobacter cholecystus]
MVYASLKSIASYVPSRCVSNADFEKIVDTSDEWITKRTGIKTRYFAQESEATSDLATKAGELAIKRAGLKPSNIDMVIVATLSPDFIGMPSTACITSYNLGIQNVPAFDITTACTGFIYLLSIAKVFIQTQEYKNILIIGSEKISSLLDFSDRSTCVLFGDGAGAAVLSATQDPQEAILDVHISANGKYSDFLITPACGSRTPASVEALANHLQFIKMKGNETFKLAVKTLANDVDHILKKNSIAPSEVKYFIPHQANLRIISAVGEMLDFSKEQIVVTVDKYGNTSAASIPMAINEVFESGKLQKGDLLLLDAFGGGLTWGSALLRFAGSLS